MACNCTSDRPSYGPRRWRFQYRPARAEGKSRERRSRHRTHATPSIAKSKPCPTGADPSATDGFNCRGRCVILLMFREETRKQLNDILEAAMSSYKVSSAETSAHQPRLAVENQKGFANEPLPLGISVKDGSGVETLTVAGLAEGIELSLGTPQGSTGWLVSARDLDKTFIGTRQDFVGVMDATV